MFKVGDLVYLRPMSLHDKGALYDYDFDLKLLRDTYRGTGINVRDDLRWFADEYVDWRTECLLCKPVIILDVATEYDFRPGYRVAPPGYVPDATWDIRTPWWTGFKSLTREVPAAVQITRRLTVRPNNA